MDFLKAKGERVHEALGGGNSGESEKPTVVPYDSADDPETIIYTTRRTMGTPN